MSDKQKARQRAELLKSLREAHRETVEHAKNLLKEQKDMCRRICQATREAPKTVPEIAAATGIAADSVLWYVTALKKYGDVAETGKCGDYYLYQHVKYQQAKGGKQ